MLFRTRILSQPDCLVKPGCQFRSDRATRNPRTQRVFLSELHLAVVFCLRQCSHPFPGSQPVLSDLEPYFGLDDSMVRGEISRTKSLEVGCLREKELELKRGPEDRRDGLKGFSEMSGRFPWRHNPVDVLQAGQLSGEASGARACLHASAMAEHDRRSTSIGLQNLTACQWTEDSLPSVPHMIDG